MIATIKNFLGLGSPTDYTALLKKGAQIVDVRTPNEFGDGHIKGSINIPLDKLQQNFNKLKKEKTVITCCASGIRSASAKQVLVANGFLEVYNGGGWASLQNKLN